MVDGPPAGALIDRLKEVMGRVAVFVEQVVSFEIGNQHRERLSAASRYLEPAVGAPCNDIDKHELPDVCRVERVRRPWHIRLLSCKQNTEGIGVNRGAVGQRTLQDTSVQIARLAKQRSASPVAGVATRELSIGRDETQLWLWWVEVENRHVVTMTRGCDSFSLVRTATVARA